MMRKSSGSVLVNVLLPSVRKRVTAGASNTNTNRSPLTGITLSHCVQEASTSPATLPVPGTLFPSSCPVIHRQGPTPLHSITLSPIRPLVRSTPLGSSHFSLFLPFSLWRVRYTVVFVFNLEHFMILGISAFWELLDPQYFCILITLANIFVYLNYWSLGNSISMIF